MINLAAKLLARFARCFHAKPAGHLPSEPSVLNLPASFYDRMGAGMDPLFEGLMRPGVETCWSPNDPGVTVGDVLALDPATREAWVRSVLERPDDGNNKPPE